MTGCTQELRACYGLTRVDKAHCVDFGEMVAIVSVWESPIAE